MPAVFRGMLAVFRGMLAVWFVVCHPLGTSRIRQDDQAATALSLVHTNVLSCSLPNEQNQHNRYLT
jgi:hypothetical protein